MEKGRPGWGQWQEALGLIARPSPPSSGGAGGALRSLANRRVPFSYTFSPPSAPGSGPTLPSHLTPNEDNPGVQSLA